MNFNTFYKGNLQQLNTKLASEILRHFRRLSDANKDKLSVSGWRANGANQVSGACVRLQLSGYALLT